MYQMFDTTDIILTYQDVSERLTKLASGNYLKIDSYYKHFYSFFDVHPAAMEYFLQQNSHWLLPAAEARQEVALVMHRTINKYFSKKGKKQRKKKYTLGYLLHQRGVLRLTRLIQKRLGERKAEAGFAHSQKTTLEPFEDAALLSEVNPQRLLTQGSLSLKQKMFLYRLVWEGKSLRELEKEFGGNWAALQDLIQSIQ